MDLAALPSNMSGSRLAVISGALIRFSLAQDEFSSSIAASEVVLLNHDDDDVESPTRDGRSPLDSAHFSPARQQSADKSREW